MVSSDKRAGRVGRAHCAAPPRDCAPSASSHPYGTALALVGTQLHILPLMLLAQVGDGGSDFAVAAAFSLVLMGVVVSLREGASVVRSVPVTEALPAPVVQALQRLALTQQGPSRHRQPGP